MNTPSAKPKRKQPAFSISIEGEPMPQEAYERLTAWQYEDVEHVDKLSLSFANFDINELFDELFPVGAVVEFRFGYINELSAPKFFTVGKVSGFTEIDVDCFEVITIFNAASDEARIWEEASLDEVVSEIAAEHDLKHEVQERVDANGVTVKFDYFRPAGIPDLAFLHTLARHIGYEVWIEGDTLFFMPRRYWMKPDAEYTYYGAKGRVLSFEPQINALHLRGAQSGGGFDLEKAQSFFFIENGETQTTSYLAGEMWSQKDMMKYYREVKDAALTQVPMSSLEEAQDLLAGKYRKSMEDQITAELVVIGEPLLKARRVIVVSGVRKYSGKYYVLGVTHSFDGSGFVSSARLTRNAAFDESGKYSRENVESLVNKERMSAQEFVEAHPDSHLAKWYKRKLKL